MPLSHLGLAVLLLFTSPASKWLAADEGDDPGFAAVKEQVQRIDEQLSAIDQSEAKLREELLGTRRQATDLDRKWKGLLGQLERVQTQQAELEQKLKEQREVSEKASAKQRESMTAVEAARKQLHAAQERLLEAERQLQTANVEAEAAAAPLRETQNLFAAVEPQIEPLQQASSDADVEIRQVHQAIESTESRIAQVARQRNEQHEKIESLLRASGQWISFADQIAPIFYGRCLACHNARNAQGGYNMATFAAIHSHGESGTAIQPGDADDSRLLQLIEEGAMPYDADPLPAEEVTLIRRWIDQGARIDSTADAEADLMRLIPRVIQPVPPQHYHVPLPVTALAIDPSGALLASSGYHEVLLWSLPSSQLSGRISNVAERVHGLAFHPDGRRLAVASGTPGRLGEVKIFDIASGALVEDLLVSADSMFSVAFSPDGDRLAAAGADGTIAIFSLDAPRRPHLIEDHSDWVNSISWSSDSKLLLSTSRDKTAKVFDAQTHKLKITFSGHNQNVTAAIFLADGKRVISGGEDQKIRVWNLTDAKQDRDISQPGSELSGLSVIAEDRVLSVGTDTQIRVHNIADGDQIEEWVAPSKWISSLAITADRTVLFLGDQAGLIHRVPLVGATAGAESWQAVPQRTNLGEVPTQ